MSSHEPSKVTGMKDRVVGGAKETFGHLVGNEKIEAEVNSPYSWPCFFDDFSLLTPSFLLGKGSELARQV